MITELEKKFHNAMLDLYDKTVEECPDYKPKIFKRMINSLGGMETAKRLAGKYNEGFAILVEYKRMDLTIEAFICDNEEFHPLFDPKLIQSSRELLDKMGYYK